MKGITKKENNMVRNIKAVISAVLLLGLTVTMCSCSRHVKHEGVDYWLEHNEGMSSYTIAKAGILMDEKFLDDYKYSDGNFYYQSDTEGLFSNTLERTFAWFTYDEEIYQQAKNAVYEEGAAELNSSRKINGFSFYMRQDWQFPTWFSAVGFNDESKTIVFLGFYDSFDFDKTNEMLAKTNFEVFLNEYYGEWYDWGLNIGA